MMAKLTIKRSLDDMKDKNVNGHLKFENVLANQELPAEVRDQIRLKGISCKVNVNKLTATVRKSVCSYCEQVKNSGSRCARHKDF